MMATDGIASILLAHWPKIAVATALLSLGAATAQTVKSVSGVPAALARHDSNTVTMSDELREQTRIQRESLCIQIAQLRRDDWTRCLVAGPR